MRASAEEESAQCAIETSMIEDTYEVFVNQCGPCSRRYARRSRLGICIGASRSDLVVLLRLRLLLPLTPEVAWDISRNATITNLFGDPLKCRRNSCIDLRKEMSEQARRIDSVLVKSIAHPWEVRIGTAYTPAKRKTSSASTDPIISLQANQELTTRQCRPVCRQNRLPCSRDSPTALQSPLGTHPLSFAWRRSCCSLFG